VLRARSLTGIGFGPGERLLQSGTAGLNWRQDYSVGDAFFVARNALPIATRTAALQRYLTSPPDGATADGISAALVRLAGGSLLSPGSTALLLGWMKDSHTGPLRVRGGLVPGWSFAHKTGTGQELAGLATGYNDVGLLTGPSSQRYAIAILIAETHQPIPVRQALMSGVAHAVIAAAP
jgi:beta-lactamase class A